MKNILVITGSPRRRGVSSRYAEELVAMLGSMDARIVQWSVAESSVGGCTGCEACRKGRGCIIIDDMQRLYTLLDAADEVHVVCPVYFSGAPGQFKNVLDRLQPYWELRCGPNAQPDRAHEPKRPVTLYVIGAGGDPFGYAPLETVVRSAFGAAGFVVDKVIDCIGWGQPEAEGHKQAFSGDRTHSANSEHGAARHDSVSRIEEQ